MRDAVVLEDVSSTHVSPPLRFHLSSIVVSNLLTVNFWVKVLISASNLQVKYILSM